MINYIYIVLCYNMQCYLKLYILFLICNYIVQLCIENVNGHH